jgi:hypothetical protein
MLVIFGDFLCFNKSFQITVCHLKWQATDVFYHVFESPNRNNTNDIMLKRYQQEKTLSFWSGLPIIVKKKNSKVSNHIFVV